jgi:hypothetical protein
MKRKKKMRKRGVFSDKVLAKEKWELNEEIQQKLEDLSKYRKEKVVEFLYIILFLLKSQKRNFRKFGGNLWFL